MSSLLVRHSQSEMEMSFIWALGILFAVAAGCQDPLVNIGSTLVDTGDTSENATDEDDIDDDNDTGCPNNICSTATDNEEDCWEHWPAEEAVPTVWNEMNDCQSVGEACSEDTDACGENATCDVNNGVCVPLRETTDGVGARCNEEYPFWVAELCMSFPEASCYCLGEGAKLISECQDGPPALLVKCKASTDDD